MILVNGYVSWHTFDPMKNSRMSRVSRIRAAVLLLVLVSITVCRGQSRAQTAPTAQPPQSTNPIVEYFLDWFPRVTRIQSEQPHWVTPLVTVTPRLEEEVRYDQFFQAQQNGRSLDNFGGGKGLELIPFQNTEIILGFPAWLAHCGKKIHGTKKRLAPSD